MSAIFNYIKQNLTIKLVISVVLFTLLFAVIITFIQSKNAYNEYITEKKDYISFIQDAYTKSILQNAYDINTGKLNLIAEGMINSGRINYVKITEHIDTTQQFILSEKGTVSNFADTLTLSYSQIIPETDTQQHIEWILHSHVVSFKNFFLQGFFAFLLNTILILLPLVFVIYIFIDRTVIRHLKTIEKYIENFNINVDSHSRLNLLRLNFFDDNNDEIGIVQKSINNLVSKIKKYKAQNDEFARELKKAIEKTEENKELLSRSQKLAHIGSWKLDLTTNKLTWSDETYRIFGFEPQEFTLTYEAFFDFVHPDDRAAVDEAYSVSLREGIDSYDIEHRIVREGTGEIRHVHERYAHVRDDAGTIIQSIGMVQDITERKQAEEKLSIREERYRSVIAVSNTGAWEFHRKEKYLWCSPEYFDMLGRNHEDYPMDGKSNLEESWINLIHPDDRQSATDLFANYLDGGSVGMYENYVRMRHANGSWVWIWSRGQTIRNTDGSLSDLTVGTHINITKRKQTEEFIRESAERATMQRNLITELTFDESVVNGSIDDALKIITTKLAKTLQVDRVSVWLLSEDDSVLQRRMLYDASYGVDSQIDVLNTADIPSYFEALRKESQVDADDALNDQRTKELNDNYLIPLQISSLLDSVIQQDGRLMGVLSTEHRGPIRKWHIDEKSFLSAITNLVAQLFANAERKKGEEKLKQSLKEKEIMLAEIHHRVKNNLAVVSAMLQLQSIDEENPEVQERLSTSTSRIKTIANTHENLYQHESLSRIDFSENIRTLTHEIVDNFNFGKTIKLDLSLAQVELNINQAVPCSLIVNEVIVNAMKHAFIKEKAGNIYFHLSEHDNRVQVKITDNGIGLPDDFKQDSYSGGMMIIQVLKEQLEGRFQYKRIKTGTEFSLTFEKNDAKGSSNASL